MRALRALPLALVCSLLLAGPAGAATYTHADTQHDVIHENPETATRTPAPGNRSADITRTTTRFTGRHLVLTAYLRALPTDYLLEWGIRTGPKAHDYYTAQFDNLDSGPPVSLFTQGGQRPCHIEMTTSKVHHYVRLDVPRGCLNAATHVRTGAQISVTDDGGVTFFHDDGRLDAHYGVDPALGPVVQRN